jgi:hypothetical protein
VKLPRRLVLRNSSGPESLKAATNQWCGRAFVDSLELERDDCVKSGSVVSVSYWKLRCLTVSKDVYEKGIRGIAFRNQAFIFLVEYGVDLYVSTTQRMTHEPAQVMNILLGFTGDEEIFSDINSQGEIVMTYGNIFV